MNVGPTDVLVKYTYYGDADLDGDVDGNDVGAWAVNFTGSGGSTTKTWTEGDWDYDGDVDGNDVGRWAVNFTGSGGGVLNITGAAPGAVAMLEAMGFTVVPEPASLGAARRRRGRPARTTSASDGLIVPPRISWSDHQTRDRSFGPVPLLLRVLVSFTTSQACSTPSRAARRCAADFTPITSSRSQLSQPESLIHSMPMSDTERSAMLAAVQAVPEPTGVVLLALAATCALPRRRRH